MFAEHQSRIGRYVGSGGTVAFTHVATFVLLTIRQPLWRVRGDLERIAAGDLSPLWGSKAAGFEWLQRNGATVYPRLVELVERGDTDAALELMAQCPGLGLVKAGFVLQLCWGVSGCLDTHNLVRFNLKASAFALGKAKAATRLRKAAEYNALIELLGGCEQLWDGWCQWAYDHGKGNKGHYNNADAVSAEHCAALGLS